MKKNELNMSLDVFPEWREATEKLHSLNVEMNDLLAEENKLAGEIAELVASKKVSANDRYLQQAKEKLGGETAAATPSLEKIKKRLHVVREEQQVIRRAVKLQQDLMFNLSAKLSEKLCRELEPHYRALVKRFASAIVDLANASEEIKRFTFDLDMNNVRYGTFLHPVPWQPVGDLRNPSSRASMILGELKSFGYYEGGKS